VTRSDFALALFRRLGRGDENLVVSPSSVATALAMVLLGARGRTADEIAGVLRADAAEVAALDDDVLARAAKDGVQLEISNAVWVQEGMRLRDDYAAALSERFRTTPRRADFRHHPEAARQAVNRLVAEQTHGKILELFGPGALDAATRLALTNAIYLYAQWRDPFSEEATVPEPFHLLGGGTVEAAMLRQRRRWRYAEGRDWQAVELPYEGDGFGMLLLLPRPGAFEAVQRDLGAAFLDGLPARLRPREVRLTLPKFRFDSTHGLIEALAGLGMPTAFTGAADFSGITGDEPLSVQAAVQKAHVEVDERGTTAVAATGVRIVPVAMVAASPVEVRADRPFLFFVRHLESGRTLFAGRVTDPTA
jgi:serpin B